MVDRDDRMLRARRGFTPNGAVICAPGGGLLKRTLTTAALVIAATTLAADLRERGNPARGDPDPRRIRRRSRADLRREHGRQQADPESGAAEGQRQEPEGCGLGLLQGLRQLRQGAEIDRSGPPSHRRLGPARKVVRLPEDRPDQPAQSRQGAQGRKQGQGLARKDPRRTKQQRRQQRQLRLRLQKLPADALSVQVARSSSAVLVVSAEAAPPERTRRIGPEARTRATAARA